MVSANQGNEPANRPTIAVTADTIVFTIVRGQLHVVLVERANEPFRGKWALPGGFVNQDEDLPEAAVRELAEETGVRIDPAGLSQLGVYGKPGRDPRMRVVTVAYWTIQPGLSGLTAGSDAAAARLVSVEDALDQPDGLAFDHVRILTDAVEQARRQIGAVQ